MFGLSAGEILLIALIALVLFGNEKLPQNLKKFTQGFSKAKSFMFDVNNTWQEVKEDIKKNIDLEDTKVKLKEVTKPIEIVPQEEIDKYQNDPSLSGHSDIKKLG